MGGGGCSRNSNIELLRIILILFVLIHHLLAHGVGIWPECKEGGLEGAALWYVNCLCYVAVNCFILISGYFTIKLSPSRVLRLYLQIALAGLICYLFHLYNDGQNLGRSLLTNTFLPLSHGTNWYIKVYFVFMLLAPMFNSAARSLSKRSYICLIAALLFANVYCGWIQGLVNIAGSGYDMMQFIMMYMIGSFIARFYVPRPKAWIPLLLLWLACAAAKVVFDFMPTGRNWIAYNSPSMVAGSICFFMAFLSFSFKSRAVNFIAGGTFGVYLITTHAYASDFVFDCGRDLYTSGVPGFFAHIFATFVICCAIGLLMNKAAAFAVGKIMPLVDRLVRRR